MATTAIRAADRSVIVWDTLLGRPRLVEFATVEAATRFEAAVRSGPFLTGDNDLDETIGRTDRESRALVAARGMDWLSGTGTKPRFLSLLVSEACNLGCDYCIAGTNMDSARTARRTQMDLDTALAAVDWFVAQHPAKPLINFSGGEPLVNWPVLRATLEHVVQAHGDFADLCTFSINTNATLVTDEISAFLAAHAVRIATSLDGTPEASDLVRVTRKNRLGASDRILAGWQRLRDAGCPVDGFMATFDDRNYRFLNSSVIEFAAEHGCSWVRVDCDVIHLLDHPAEETIERLWDVYRAGKKQGIAVEGFWSTPAKNLVGPDFGADIAFFCGAVSGETISVHPTGRVSACGFSSATLGSVGNGSVRRDHNAHRGLVARHVPGARDFCRGCEIEGSCAGGCNIAREESDATRSTSAIEYNCTIYREMTRRLLIDNLVADK